MVELVIKVFVEVNINFRRFPPCLPFPKLRVTSYTTLSTEENSHPSSLEPIRESARQPSSIFVGAPVGFANLRTDPIYTVNAYESDLDSSSVICTVYGPAGRDNVYTFLTAINYRW